MICPTCQLYTRAGIGPNGPSVAPRCNWRANADQLAHLRATLPAPVYSRLQILATPIEVVECSQYSGVAL